MYHLQTNQCPEKSSTFYNILTDLKRPYQWSVNFTRKNQLSTSWNYTVIKWKKQTKVAGWVIQTRAVSYTYCLATLLVCKSKKNVLCVDGYEMDNYEADVSTLSPTWD